MCCIQFQVCAAYAGIALTDALGTSATAGTIGRRGTYNQGWTIDIDTTPAVIDSAILLADSDSGLVDAQCSGDYVEIPCEFTLPFEIIFVHSKYNRLSKEINQSKLDNAMK